jgi:hypothetical protein
MRRVDQLKLVRPSNCFAVFAAALFEIAAVQRGWRDFFALGRDRVEVDAWK